MGKKLKICLAMGGGVSLGTFSGAALTEALKLLVLYGQDKNGEKYESVELDGMSGASAGSIALAILMRCLIDYKSLLSLTDIQMELKATNVEEANFNLNQIVMSNYIESTDTKFEIIKCLEVAQIVQKMIWVDALSTEKLFDSNNENEFLNPFSVLTRSNVMKDAKKIVFHNIEFMNINNRMLISDRALMAFTMANLSPIAYGEKSVSSRIKIPKLVDNLQTSTNIKNHNEIRVFELQFKEKITKDERYITIPTSKNSNNSKQRLINDKNTWAELLASAVASGAFPIGFPPAIITKYREEYSDHEWPNEELTHLNFAYVDGGTFNNEPIKEAFKLGAYIDFQQSNPKIREEEDRLVLFVDPSVPGDAKVSQLKSLDPLKEIKDLEFYEKKIPTKMIDVTIDLLSTVASQAEINEEAKIKEFYQNSILIKSLFDYFKGLKELKLENVLDTTFLKSTEAALSNSLKNRHISLGTRELKEFFYWKYKLICSEKKVDSCLLEQDFYEIYKVIEDFVKKGINVNATQTIVEIDKIISKTGCDVDEVKINIGSCLFLAIAELGLNQFGKDFTAERAGIFPVDNQFGIENLPGHELSRFSGFASINARHASFDKGRLDAINCLGEVDFREYHYNTMLKKNELKLQPYINKSNINQLDKEIKKSFDIHYKNWENSFAGDIEKNIRLKMVDKVVNILKSLSSSDNLKWYEIIFSRIKLIVAGIKVYSNKNHAVSKYILSADKMIELTQKSKNIAIKFRFKGNIKMMTYEVNYKGIKKVKPYFESKSGYIFFKCYLVMLPKLIGNINNSESRITTYCYLSLSQYTHTSQLRKENSISKIKDPDCILKLKSDNFNLTSLEVLRFIEENYWNLKHNINPVIEIDNTNLSLSVHDLSKPLAEEINSDWTPFI